MLLQASFRGRHARACRFLGTSFLTGTFWDLLAFWNDFLEPPSGITCWNNFLGSTADYSGGETLERCHWSKHLRMEPPCHCQSGGARVYGLADPLPLLAQFLNSDGRFRPPNVLFRSQPRSGLSLLQLGKSLSVVQACPLCPSTQIDSLL